MTITTRRCLLAAALLGSLPAAAEAPRIEAARDASAAVADPIAAVTRATQASLALRQLGDLAIDRSKEARVRQLGTVVRNDAGRANRALRTLAARMQIATATNVRPDAGARLAALEKRAPDASFDRALLDEMLRQQRDAAAVLQQVSADVPPGQRRLLNEAALSLREAERATAIERQPMKP